MSGDVKLWLAVAGLVLSVVNYIPYLYDIWRGTTKPHGFTWLIWAVLTGVAAFGQMADHAGPGAWITLFSAGACSLIAILSLRYGEKNITRGDIISFVAALLTIPLWLVTHTPLYSMILVTAIDVLAFYPTFRKSWDKPGEETLSCYAMACVKFGLVLLALENYTVITTLYPAALVVLNLFFVGYLLMRRAALKKAVLAGAFLLCAFAAHAVSLEEIRACIDTGKAWNPFHARCEEREKQKTIAQRAAPEGCAWQAQHFEIDKTRHVTVDFRTLQCGASVTYVYDDATGAVYRDIPAPENLAIKFWDYAPGDLESFIVHLNAPTMKEDERLDCELIYVPDVQGYMYVPNDAYLKSLMQDGASFKACGALGFDSQHQQYLKILNDNTLVLVRDDPLRPAVDAMSFRLKTGLSASNVTN